MEEALTPDEVRVAAGAADIRRHYRQSVFGVLLVAATCLHVHLLFAGRAPALNLWLWSGGIATILLCWMAGLVEALVREPDDTSYMGRVRRVSIVLMVALNLVIASMVWLLLPYGDGPLRQLMVIYLLGFVVTQLLLAPATSAVPGFAVVSVLGSVALFFLTAGGPLDLAVALFVGGLGGALYVVRLTLNGAVRDALAAQVAMEAANAELARALTEVAAARDAKSRFIAAATHDLAQPIAAARLFFESAVAVGEAEVRRDATDGVRRALASAAALLDHMLDHLRLEAGAVVVRAGPVAVRQVIEDVAALHRPAAVAAGMTVRVVGGGVVVANPVLLARAVGNLVGNAITHANGERVLVGARQHGGRVRIWVIDDGDGVAGIDPGGPPLFSDYVQGRRRVPGGFGIGLASARRAALAMGGDAGHEPIWSGGAAFWIDVPAAVTVPLCKAA